MALKDYVRFWKKHVVTAVTEIWNKFPRTSVGTYPGHDPDQSLACDFMIPMYATTAGRTYGQKVADWVWKNAERLGVWYVIFWGRIISRTRPSKGWLPYFDRNNANPSRSHHNHVHVSWYEKPPKDWKPTPVTDQPKPYTDGWVPDLPWVAYLDKQQIGITKSDTVWIIQKALGLKPYDGNYTQAVRDAVKGWQLNNLKDPAEFCDGILGPRQAELLLGGHVQIEEKS